MPSSYTSRNRLEKQATGENTNSWGTRLNAYTTDLLDAALDGKTSYTLSGTKTLTSSNGAADEARMKVQHITGGTGGTVTIPAVEKTYFVVNEASGAVYFTCGGVQATIPADSNLWVYCNGTDCWTQTPLEYAAAADANYKATSVTSLTIGAGTKSLTIQAGKTFAAGDFVKISSTASPTTKWMWGTVTSYNSTTGAMVAVTTEYGTIDTLTSWNVALSGSQGANGDVLPALGAGSTTLRQAADGGSVEWVNLNWVQLDQKTPSGGASANFTSITPAYTDLLVRASFTHPGTVTLGVQVSADSSNYSVATSMVDTTAGTYTGYFLFQNYNDDTGFGIFLEGTGASPLISASNLGFRFWVSTGGIDGLKFLFNSGNITGTFTLYGRK